MRANDSYLVTPTTKKEIEIAGSTPFTARKEEKAGIESVSRAIEGNICPLDKAERTKLVRSAKFLMPTDAFVFKRAIRIVLGT